MRAILLLTALTLVACTSTRTSQTLSSGIVGCAPGDITIENETRYRGIQSFEAVCRGKRFACTYQHPDMKCAPTT